MLYRQSCSAAASPGVAHPAVNATTTRKHPQDVLEPKVFPQPAIQHLYTFGAHVSLAFVENIFRITTLLEEHLVCMPAERQACRHAGMYHLKLLQQDGCSHGRDGT